MKEFENNQWIAHYRTDQPHFGLERMVELLALRWQSPSQTQGHPYRRDQWQGFDHCFFEKMLEKLGLRVGVFSSPYLYSLHTTDLASMGNLIPRG